MATKKQSALNILPEKDLNELRSAIDKGLSKEDIKTIILTRFKDKLGARADTISNDYNIRKFIREYKKQKKETAITPEVLGQVDALDTQFDTLKEQMVREGKYDSNGILIDSKATTLESLYDILSKYRATAYWIEKIPKTSLNATQMNAYNRCLEGMNKCIESVAKEKSGVTQDKVDISVFIKEDMYYVHSLWIKNLKKYSPDKVDLVVQGVDYDLKSVRSKYQLPVGSDKPKD